MAKNKGKGGKNWWQGEQNESEKSERSEETGKRFGLASQRHSDGTKTHNQDNKADVILKTTTDKVFIVMPVDTVMRM